MAKINDEQFLHSVDPMWTKLSETEELSKPKTEKLRNHNALSFSEHELDLKYSSKKESGTQATSENEKSILRTLPRTQVPESSTTVSEQRRSGFRRCGGLSEY